MKKNLLKVLPLLLLGANLNALNIDEAIKLSLENNNSFKKQNYIYEESKENVNLQKGNFLPSLDLAYNYEANKYDAGNGKDNANASATLSYNLFNGLKDKYNLDSSKSLLNSSKYDLTAKKFDIILNTQRVYINYLRSIRNIQTRQNAFELLEQQYKDSQNRFEQGLLAKNDLLQVNANMLQEKQNLFRAKADSKIAKYELKNALGGYLDLNENIEDLNKDTNLDTNYNIENLNLRSEIQAIKNSIKSIKEQKNANNSSYMPKADLNLSYTKYGEDSSLNDESLSLDEQKTASLNLTWNLYNGFKDKTQDVIFQKRILQLNEDLNELKLTINLQYESASEEYNVAILNFQTAKTSLEQAKENYKIVNNRFKEGISTTTDLINANFLLSSAKQSFDEAYYDRFLAKAALDRIFEIE